MYPMKYTLIAVVLALAPSAHAADGNQDPDGGNMHFIVDGIQSGLASIFSTLGFSAPAPLPESRRGQLVQVQNEISQAQAGVSQLQSNYNACTNQVSSLNSQIGDLQTKLNLCTAAAGPQDANLLAALNGIGMLRTQTPDGLMRAINFMGHGQAQILDQSQDGSRALSFIALFTVSGNKVSFNFASSVTYSVPLAANVTFTSPNSTISNVCTFQGPDIINASSGVQINVAQAGADLFGQFTEITPQNINCNLGGSQPDVATVQLMAPFAFNGSAVVVPGPTGKLNLLYESQDGSHASVLFQ